ncbi:hypothetical protein B0H13DRAFT_1009175 [Mycena leptocephala]|nr:hypothetical protein B0H13DRAFT_1009175 [Mycena leptocephala]
MAANGSQFLSLPPELILACLANLSFSDLDSCSQCGNRLLRNIIDTSVLLRYRRRQDRAGLEENSYVASHLSISDRLENLQRREESWLNFAPRLTHTITIDFPTPGLYDLTSDIYFVGDTADPNTGLCTAVKAIHTSPGFETQWRTINAGRPIIDFGTALEEHDLIAIVTYTRYDGNAQLASIDVLLLNFSTGGSHSLAACPVLHIHDVEVTRGRPRISVEIVGQNLALVLVYRSDEADDMDTLHLYNWKSGKPKMAPLPIYNTGLAFLTDEILVIPNSLDATLDLLHIPAEEKLPQSLHSFRLPTLKRFASINVVRCRGEPNPRVSIRRPSRAAFLPRPLDSLLLFSPIIGSPSGTSDHMFVVHRARLAAAINLRPDDIDIPWEAWGPQCTRWIDADEFSIRYITATAGQRMVAIAHDAPGFPSPINLLDFNETNVRAQRARGPVDGPRATVRVVEASTISFEPFAHPITSLLPYVEILSKANFNYGAVLINDENIIGARFGDGSIKSLEVHHFG